jgi:hypothetical protein
VPVLNRYDPNRDIIDVRLCRTGPGKPGAIFVRYRSDSVDRSCVRPREVSDGYLNLTLSLCKTSEVSDRYLMVSMSVGPSLRQCAREVSDRYLNQRLPIKSL